ncbi:hypothetical protein V8G54_006052 [Vigna mungo]|uniref:Uncharacterized protein n=1 Tax=Vigna mungo TaxID=3915 RepID=A0AAQ3P0F2_VIGMU
MDTPTNNDKRNRKTYLDKKRENTMMLRERTFDNEPSRTNLPERKRNFQNEHQNELSKPVEKDFIEGLGPSVMDTSYYRRQTIILYPNSHCKLLLSLLHIAPHPNYNWDTLLPHSSIVGGGWLSSRQLQVGLSVCDDGVLVRDDDFHYRGGGYSMRSSTVALEAIGGAAVEALYCSVYIHFSLLEVAQSVRVSVGWFEVIHIVEFGKLAYLHGAICEALRFFPTMPYDDKPNEDDDDEEDEDEDHDDDD